MNQSHLARYSFFGLVVYGPLLLWLWLRNPAIAEENRLMENLQALFLLGGLVCAFCAALTRDRAMVPWIPWMLTLFFLTLFLREIDLERMEVPGLLISLGSGLGRNLLLGLGWLAGIGIFYRRRAMLWPRILLFLRTPAFILLAAGVLCYCLSIPFDKRMFFSDRALNRFLEELTENFGTWLLFGGALASLRPALKQPEQL